MGKKTAKVKNKETKRKQAPKKKPKKVPKKQERKGVVKKEQKVKVKKNVKHVDVGVGACMYDVGVTVQHAPGFAYHQGL